MQTSLVVRWLHNVLKKKTPLFDEKSRNHTGESDMHCRFHESFIIKRNQTTRKSINTHDVTIRL